MCKIVALLLVLFSASVVESFRSTRTDIKLRYHIKQRSTFDFDSKFGDSNSVVTDNASSVAFSPLLIPVAAACMFPSSCHAAVEGINNAETQIPSALVAYGHYLGIVLVAISLTTERLLIKPGMSLEEEGKVAIADVVYGIAGTLITVTGYYRVTQYAKGWEFYAHEPIFWVKLFLFSILGASSFFPTVKIIQRAVHAQNYKDGKRPDALLPMSEKLANRMIKIINGELLALLSIPLTASLMSRGVGYADWLPWQAGAAPAGLALGGLGFKYVKEALTWKEDDE